MQIERPKPAPPLVHWRLLILSGLLLAALDLPAPAGDRIDYHEFYVLGLEAVDFELWADGVILFSKAVKERPTAGGLVRPYGTWTESYVPHYYLGLCLFELGRYPEAFEAWENFASQPPYEYPRNRAKKRRVVELRSRLPELLPGRISELREELQFLLRRIRTLEESSVGSLRGEGDRIPPAADLATALDQSSGGDATRAPLETVRNLGAAVEEATQWVNEQEAALARIRRDEAIAAELDERNRIGALFAGARASVETGGCARDAIDDLEEILHGGIDSRQVGLARSLIAATLARAHHQCESAAWAARYATLAERWSEPGEAIDPVISDLAGDSRSALSPAPSRLEVGASTYARALGRIATGRCSHRALEELAEAEIHLASLASHELRSVGIDFRPTLARARGEWNCRDRSAALASLEAARDRGEASAREIDPLRRRIEASRAADLYSASYALLVIAYDYQHDTQGWDDLPGARADLDALADSLAAHGFEVEIMDNPTADALDRRLRNFTAEHGRDPGNRLVVYYAGHGWTEEAYGVQNGYIVPVDTPYPPGNVESFKYLTSMGIFELNARPMLARHALFVFDTCFGGLVFEQSKHAQPASDSTPPTQELVEKPVRMFMSAGGAGEPVPDFSVFRRALVRGLDGAADSDSDAMVLGRELAPYVRDAVTESSATTPQWGVLASGNLGEGDIAFEAQAFASQVSTGALDVEFDFWDTVLGSTEPDEYLEYLHFYPDGAFAALARAALDRLPPATGQRPK